MGRDEALLAEAAAGGASAVLRFYTWAPPAVSLGRFQRVEGVNLEYAARRGWDVVRRPTGGRGVLHQHELTYAIVLPPDIVGGVGVRSSYRVLTGLLEVGLQRLGAGAGWDLNPCPGSSRPTSGRAGSPANCFALAAECDTVVGQGKLVGSAQVRRDGALLQHGAILLDAEPDAWEALFGEPGRLLSLRTLLGRRPSCEEVQAALCAGLTARGVALEAEEVASP